MSMRRFNPNSLDATVPHSLNPGDLLAVFSPSWAGPNLFPLRFGRGLRKLHALGFRTIVSAHASANVDGKAGTVRQRAEDLEALFCDTHVKAIIASIGGDDARTLVPLIDWEAVARHPKWFIGYSDTTALQCALLSKAGMASLYGPTVMTDFAELPNMPIQSEMSFLKSVCDNSFPSIGVVESLYEEGPDWASQNAQEALRRSVKATAPFVSGSGIAHGRVVGGCIESLVELVCSSGGVCFSAGAGDILLLESSRQRLSAEALAKQLETLSACIDFSSLEGIVFGAKCWNSSDYEIVAMQLANACAKESMPMVIGLPFGHITPCLTVALGINYRLDLSELSNPKLIVAL